MSINLPSHVNLGKREDNSQQFKTKIKVHTIIDDKYHEYFYSFNYDADDTEYMHTAELKAPYSNELMEYWSPISTECVVYGTNKGDYKILYVGRVREIKQEGYSIVISLQSYGWKFEQTISPEFAQELSGLSCDVVLEIILEMLKIPSYTMDEKTKFFLQQYALDDNGEVVQGTEVMEKIPDLLERIGGYSPNMTKNTIVEKLKENKTGNIKDINYTLQYIAATPTMKKLQNQSTAEADVVAANSTSGAGTSTTSQTTAPSTGNYGDGLHLTSCPDIKADEKNPNKKAYKVNSALCMIRHYVRGQVNEQNPKDMQALKNACSRINGAFYKSHGEAAYKQVVLPWLNTIFKNAKSKEAENLQRAYLRKLGIKLI